MKEQLLEAVEEGQAREAELEALVADEPADPEGRWSAKDHLAHLAWWRMRTARTMAALRTGGEPPPAVADDDGVQNAIVYAELKDRPAEDVKGDARASWLRLREEVALATDEDLSRPNPRRPEAQVWEGVPGAVGHAGTHIWSCLLDAGEETRALDVALWSAQVEGRFFNTPRQLADSRYNLACVYARLGRAAEALPLLRASFEANPDLAAWARKDRDLDGIREELAPILL